MLIQNVLVNSQFSLNAAEFLRVFKLLLNILSLSAHKSILLQLFLEFFYDFIDALNLRNFLIRDDNFAFDFLVDAFEEVLSLPLVID